MIKKILTVAAVLGFAASISSCSKETENDPVFVKATDEVNVSALAGKIVTISFEADAFGVAANPATMSVANGSKFNLPAPVIDEKSEKAKLFEFKGWAESADGEVKYEAGKEYEVAGNAVLYAVWQLKPFEQLKTGEVFKDKLTKFLETAKNLYNGNPFNLTMPDTAFGGGVAENDYWNDLMKALAETQANVILDLSKTSITNYSDQYVSDQKLPQIYGVVLPETTRGITIQSANIKSLNIPKYVTYVNISGTSLSSVTFDEGSKCKNVSITNVLGIENIELPSTVEGFSAQYCYNLKSLDASNVKTCLIHGCSSLSSLTLGVELNSLDIQECGSLESITIPDQLEATNNITVIISDCPALKSVSIPGNVSISTLKAPLMALSSIEIRTSGKLSGQLPTPASANSEIVVAPLGTYDQEKQELFTDHGLTISFVYNGKKIEKLSDFKKLNSSNVEYWTGLINELVKILPHVESKNDKGEVIKDDNGNTVMRKQTFEDVTGIKDDTQSSTGTTEPSGSDPSGDPSTGTGEVNIP